MAAFSIRRSGTSCIRATATNTASARQGDTAVGIRAEGLRPVHTVASGTRDSQKSRCVFAHITALLTFLAAKNTKLQHHNCDDNGKDGIAKCRQSFFAYERS